MKNRRRFSGKTGDVDDKPFCHVMQYQRRAYTDEQKVGIYKTINAKY